MIEKQLEVVNLLGLHARAAARFVQEASTFESDINVRFANKEISGKSIMGVMMLAAANGSTVKIEASGEDSGALLIEVEQLVDNYFGETE